jgi:Aerobic-type carbon monoxide dehydrogenase, small subunit CoxS/CutS homologs
MIVPFELNGSQVYIDSNPGERLVHILRQRFKLLGSKEGCLSGRCGSCMVLMNGKPVPSCIVPVFQVRNASITTIESFLGTSDCRDILDGFAGAKVSMCGFCNAGKIFIAQAILETDTRPTKEEIRRKFSGNICRCTSIDDLVDGVKLAGTIRRKRQNVK